MGERIRRRGRAGVLILVLVLACTGCRAGAPGPAALATVHSADGRISLTVPAGWTVSSCANISVHTCLRVAPRAGAGSASPGGGTPPAGQDGPRIEVGILGEGLVEGSIATAVCVLASIGLPSVGPFPGVSPTTIDGKRAYSVRQAGVRASVSATSAPSGDETYLVCEAGNDPLRRAADFSCRWDATVPSGQDVCRRARDSLRVSFTPPVHS